MSSTLEPSCDVWIIDADVETSRELGLVVEACGCSVQRFTDAAVALDALQTTRPRLVVVELLLPGLDGFEFCQYLRSVASLQELPIVCISGLAWGGVDLAALLERRFGARFLPKGSLAADFVEVLAQEVGPLGGRKSSQTPAAESAVTEGRFGLTDAKRMESLTREFERTVARTPARKHRREVRVDKEYQVRFRSLNEFVCEYSRNISAGGVFIHAPTPPDIDEIIDVRLELPSLERVVECRARVVHHVTPAMVADGAAAVGFGVQFVDLPAGERKFLRQLVVALRAFAGSAAGGGENEAPATRAACVLLVGLPAEPIMKTASFLQRSTVRVVSLPSVGASLDLLATQAVGVAVVSESALGDEPEATLGKLRSAGGDSLTVLILQSTTRDLSRFFDNQLCHGILDPTVTMTKIREEVLRHLGLRGRGGPRVHYRADVQLSVAQRSLVAHMVDISCGGALLSTSEDLDVGVNLRLHFDLPGAEATEARAVVVRCDQDKRSEDKFLAGIAFYAMPDGAEAALRALVQSSTNFREFFSWMKKRCAEEA